MNQILCILLIFGVLCLSFPSIAQEPGIAAHDPAAATNTRLNDSSKPAPKIKVDWNKVNKTGFLKELLKDADFLSQSIDLREEGQKQTLSEIKSLLDVPIIQSNIGKFVKEAVLGDSNLRFGFEEDALKEILIRLSEKSEDAIAHDLVEAVSGGDALARMKFEALYASLFKKKTPELESIIKEVAEASGLEIRHLTKAVRPTFSDKPVVAGFTVFASGRFGVSFKDAHGNKKYLVVETEDKLGHLKPVIPGKTIVDGYIAVCKDSDCMNPGKYFNPVDQTSLLTTLVKSWGTPDKITDDTKKGVLLAVAAVYANGDQGKLEKALEK